MSFGSAAHSDVEFRTNTGQFKADMSAIRREYQQTTAGMSSDALKAAIAQEKLDRAIAAHGPTSYQAKAATLAYRNSLNETSVAAVRTGHSLRTAERDVDRFGRGVLSGSGLLRGMGRAAAFASTAFLGGAGLIYAIRRVIEVSNEEQTAHAQVRNALSVNGLSWSQYGGQIEAATSKLETHTAFTKGELDGALSKLVRRTGDVNQAIELTAVAADVARGRNIGLSESADLVVKGVNGQTAAFKRLGLDVKTVTTNQDALAASGVKASQQQKDQAKAADQAATREANVALLRKRYSGAAAIFLETEAGKQALLNARIRDSENIIGTALRPTLNKLFGDLATWLEHLNKTGKLQRDVNRAVRDGTQIVHGIRDAFNLLAPPIKLVIKALGGLEHAVETALVIGAVLKVQKFAASFGLIRAASATTRTAVIADAAAEEAALAGLAMPITIPITLAVVGAIGLDRFVSHFAKSLPGSPSNSDPGFKAGDPSGDNANWTDAQWNQYFANHGQTRKGQTFKNGMWQRTGARPGKPAAAAGTPRAGDKPGAPVVDLSGRLKDDLLNAQIAGNQGQELTVYQAQSAYLEKLLKQPGLTQAERLDLKGQLAGVSDSIRSINAGFAADAKAAAAARRAAEAARRAAAAAALSAHRTALATQRQRLENRLTVAIGKAKVDPKTNKLVASPAEKRAVDELLAFFTRESHDTSLPALDRSRYAGLVDKERAKIAKEQDAQLRAANKARIQQLTGKPVGLETEYQTALAHNASAAKLLAILRKEKAAIEEQVKTLRAIGAGKGAILKARTNEAQVQAKINGLTKQKSQVDFFTEAAHEFATYGSNIAARNGVLSGQDARGMLAQIALLLRESNRHAKTTAHSTKTIARARPSQIHTARALAEAG